MIDDGAKLTASFRVHGTFVLGVRSLFIVRGVVTGGTVRAGQRVISPVGFDAPITGVEHALSSMGGGPDQSALTFRYASAAQLAQWRSLAQTGTEMSLSDPGAAGARSP